MGDWIAKSRQQFSRETVATGGESEGGDPYPDFTFDEDMPILHIKPRNQAVFPTIAELASKDPESSSAALLTHLGATTSPSGRQSRASHNTDTDQETVHEPANGVRLDSSKCRRTPCINEGDVNVHTRYGRPSRYAEEGKKSDFYRSHGADVLCTDSIDVMVCTLNDLASKTLRLTAGTGAAFFIDVPSAAFTASSGTEAVSRPAIERCAQEQESNLQQ